MVIHTKRCTIRPFVEADIDEFMVYRNDMEWMKYQGFKGHTKQEYRDALIGKNSLQNRVQFAIICNETNMLIGDIYIKEEAFTYWIGYAVSRSMARQGYASEAVSAVMDALNARGAAYIKASVETENVASIALLMKLGFRYSETMDGEQIFVADSCNGR